LYVLLVFVVATLLTEIIYLNVSCMHTLCHTRNAKPRLESLESFQCRLGNANILCFLYIGHNRHVSCALPGIQGYTTSDCHRHHGILADLLRGSLVTIIQVGQGRPRFSRLQRRPRPSPDSGRNGRARI
jgi:hypothetical protein